jgi:GAF domain-containing protein
MVANPVDEQRISSPQSRYADVLQQARQDMDDALDLQDVLDKTLRRAVESVGARDGTLMLVNEDGKLCFRARFGRSLPEGKVQRSFGSGEGVAGWVLESGAPYICSDTGTDSRFLPIISGVHIGSLVSVPIISHGTVLGVLNVDSADPDSFSEADAGLLLTLASQTAGAIERAELLQSLREISNRTVGGVKDLYDYVVGTVHRFTGCPVALWRVDLKNRDRAMIRAHKGLREEYARRRRLNLEGSLVGMVLQQGQVVQVADVQQDERVSAVSRREARGQRWKSMLIVPLLAGSRRAEGALSIYSLVDRPFTPWVKDLLLTFAGQAGVTIQNAERLHTIQRLNEVGQVLAAMQDAPEVLERTLERIARAAIEVLGADTVDLYQYQADKDHFDLPPVRIGERRFPEIVPTKVLPDDVVARIARTGIRIYTSNARKDPVLAAEWERSREGLPAERFVVRERIVSSAAVAMQVGGEVVGVLFVSYRLQRDIDADPEFRRLIDSFADFGAVAIRNARLLQQKQTLVERTRTLGDVSKAITGALELGKVAELILDGLQQVIEYRKASVQIIREGDRSQIAGRGFDEKASSTWRLRPVSEDRLISRVVESKKPLILSDVTEDPDWERRSETEDVRSWVGLPLVYGGNVVGLLTLDQDQTGFYSQTTEETLIPFADQAAIAINNARLVQELDEGAKGLARLQEVTTAISREVTDLQGVLRLIVDNLGHVFPGASCALRLYNSKTDVFTPMVATGVLEELVVDNPPRPLGEGTSRYVISKRAARYLDEDALTTPTDGGPVIRDEVLKKGVKAAAYLPLLTEEDVIGVLYVDMTTPHRFTDSDKQILEFFADQATVAIENARLLEARREQESLANALRNTASVLNSSLDPQEVLDRILENVGQVVPHSAATIMLFESGLARIVARYGYAERGIETEDHPFTIQSIPSLSSMSQTGLPCLIPDTETDSRWMPREDTDWVRSYVGAPILSKDRQVVGFLNLDSDRTDFFTEASAERLQAFANQAALAIENAQLYAQIRQYADNLTELLAIAGDLTSTMEDVDHVLVETLRQTVKLFGVTRGGILYYEGREGRVVAAFDTASPDRARASMDTRFPESPLQDTIRYGGKPVLLTDVATDMRLTEYERARLQGSGIQSSMILPLRARGRVLGSLGLDEIRHKREFTFQEQELALLLADLAAVAIDNARIYGIAEEELRSVIRVAQSLIQEALKPGINLEEFLRSVMEQTLKLLEFTAGWLLLREGSQVRIHATDANHKADVRRVFLIEDCVSGLVMLEKKAESFPDLEKLPDKYARVYKAPTGGPTPMRSELVVPLMVGDTAIGALNVESEQLGAFEPRHVEMLELLGGHAALAIELARSRAEASALSAGGLELARATEMPEVVRSVLRRALGMIGGKFGQVLLREGDELVVAFTTNVPPQDLGSRVPIDDCVTGLAVAEHKPVIVPDVGVCSYFVVELPEGLAVSAGKLLQKATDQPRYKRALEAEKETIRVEFVVPLTFKDEILGVLNVETPRESGFSDKQRIDLEGFAEANASAFRDALLADDRQALSKLLDDAVARVDTAFGEVLRCDGDELVIVQTTGGEPSGTRVRIRESVTGLAVSRQEAVYIPDVALEPKYQRYLGADMKSELAVPLIIGQDVIGVLNLESPVPEFFTLEHARILQAFAGQAAVAIDRAKRFEGERLAAIGGVAGDIVHRLNNPLGALSGWFELLKGEPSYAKLVADYPSIGSFVEQSEKDIARTKAIVREIRPTLKSKGLEPTALQASVAEGLSRAGLRDDIEVSSELPVQPIHVTANDRLSSVFWNLFDNARKAMPKGGRITVSADLSDKQWVLVTVVDEGRGIEPWRVEHIFEHDQSSAADAATSTHGMGLWWTKAQIERFGGAIEVSSTIGVGTKVTVKLKRATQSAL